MTDVVGAPDALVDAYTRMRDRAFKAEATLAATQSKLARAEEALLYGIGTALNELTNRGLPFEWSRESGLGVMSAALGLTSFSETVAAVRAQNGFAHISPPIKPEA